ncbi:MAG: hypothetical protein JXR48_00535 [Candidatus Delongbacteria bacterium]|nr:hypothetical protein [Candidatus Delongbacteria bacterium]MBN2833428.1 hypothetical protein [Candidatus Delongbacteria bacterium]
MKFNFSRLSTLCIVLLVTFSLNAQFAGGFGTELDPWQVSTPEQLASLNNYLGSANSDKYFKIINDIDLTEYLSVGNPGYIDGRGWIPIGTNVNEDPDSFDSFFGNVDGGNNFIIGLYIQYVEIDGIYYNHKFLGLFGSTGLSFKIENLFLSVKNIGGTLQYIGGLVGYNRGTIENCHVVGDTDYGIGQGGFAAEVQFVGGLVGINYGAVKNSSFMGNVHGNYYSGGFVGHNLGDIENSFSIGRVWGAFMHGGFVGTNSGVISNCYTSSFINFTNDLTSTGGFNGFNFGGTINNCFWNAQLSGLYSSFGGVAKSTSDLKNINTFVDWDFGTDETDWAMSASTTFGGYPILRTLQGYGIEPIGSPKEINNLQNLVWFTENSATWGNINLYTQTQDIDAKTSRFWGFVNNDGSLNVDGSGFITNKPRGFSPIGNYYTIFKGSYYGNYHTISNLYINRPEDGIVDQYHDLYVGMFGNTLNGNFENIGLVNVDITGKEEVGGLIGTSFSNMIQNCFVTGSVKANSMRCGGLIGWSTNGSIENCYTDVSISGNSAGGMIGDVSSPWLIKNCYSKGSVSGNYIGGFFGSVTSYGSNVTISNCYSLSVVNGTESIGGFTGSADIGNTSNITNNFWDTDLSGMQTSAGTIEGYCIGKSSSELKDYGTYQSIFTFPSSKSAIWHLDQSTINPDNDGYPSLAWQNLTHRLKPVIESQNAIDFNEDNSRDLILTDLNIKDYDEVLNSENYSIVIQDGLNYSHSSNKITPSLNFNGTLTIPVKISGDNILSEIKSISVTVNPVNDAPKCETNPSILPVSTLRIGGKLNGSIGVWNDPDSDE